MCTDWGERAEYLAKSRTVWFNDDYLQMLVDSVWRVDRAVKVADFGCGTGFLREALMPHFPAGSSYTGYDASAKLLEAAREKAGDGAQFICCDLLETEIAPQYDVVVCQALLMHIPGPERMLRRMIDAAAPGGLVVCMEPNWNVTNASMYVDGIDADGRNLGLLAKLWSAERARSGKDVLVGTKVPAMMRRLGLRQVGVRMNDCTHLADPAGDPEEYRRQREALRADNFCGDPGEEEAFVAGLLARGLTEEEARLQYQCERELHAQIAAHGEDFFMLVHPGLLISFGRKA
ncbi:MAG: class I SAM-dependent methyltransferase [Oscillospiraceae bacterium]|jgi:SAM-dependent methyltransferase|nr:class I SAM-dependent methyltransferase [Oscillospiraceae bacterium]